MSSLSEATLYDWDVDRMVLWLREEHLHDCVRPFSLKKINGISFLNLTEFDIKTFQISQESRRKLAKLLKRIKAKKKNVHRSFANDSTEIIEPKRPSSIPAHVIDHHEEGEIDDWGSDFDSEDEFDQEDDESCSDGEYIEPEEDESLNKEVPNVPTGLVAQLRAGLSGNFQKGAFTRPPVGQSNPQTAPLEEDEEIYDVPPEEEEFYEQPSDDSGSGIVVRPMDKKKVIRCPSSEPGEYLDCRAPQYVDKGDTAPCPPPPGRPPKPGQKVIKPPPAARQPTPQTELEIYDEVPEGEQPGCSQVVSESVGGVDVYEPWESEGPAQQETYEIPDKEPQDTYEVPDSQEQETYEVPDQGQPEQETYEVPDQEPAPPARPPPRGTGWNPLKRSPDKGKPALSKKPVGQKSVKPTPPTKPQISAAKPSQPPNPVSEKRSSRLYPNSSNTGPSKSPVSTKKQSTVLPAPMPKVLSPPPPQQITPAKKEENNNNNKKIVNETPKTGLSSSIPPARGRVPSMLEDDAPPPPPRPGPKRGQGMARASAKPPSISDSDPPVGEPVGPTSPLRKTPLPPLPSQPKSPVDQLKSSPWFHGPLDKKVAESALKSFSKEGSFIVRNSSKDPNNYALSLFFKGNVKHLRMPRTNNKYVLGDSGKVQFDNIDDLVKYYSQHQVDLKSGGSTPLTDACPVKL